MMYEYRIRRVHRVVDGDTYDLELDLGFYQFGVYRVRLLDVDTPEVYGRYASNQGKAAKEYVESWFEQCEGKVMTATTIKTDSFGRWLAHINCEGESLAESLLESGNATPYSSAGIADYRWDRP